MAASTCPWESPDRPPRDVLPTPPRTKAVRRGSSAASSKRPSGSRRSPVQSPTQGSATGSAAAARRTEAP
ncbi:hypothetical protein [Streptosporangium nondiastaticum]|uniref:hypothetical protein n=1 Tax=Streptosporangium nondiastaticum TaxID=35764 RepID=UPI0031F80363